jgi:hypothetical protein
VTGEDGDQIWSQVQRSVSEVKSVFAEIITPFLWDQLDSGSQEHTISFFANRFQPAPPKQVTEVLGLRRPTVFVQCAAVPRYVQGLALALSKKESFLMVEVLSGESRVTPDFSCIGITIFWVLS